jgi:hypothetical protein
MKAKRISWLGTLAGFTYGLSLMGASPLAAQDSCQPVHDAMDVMKREQENRQKSKFSCRYLRDESVNEETAAVYSTHSEMSDEDLGEQTSDGEIGISKSRGLPLRHEFDLDAGDGKKKHHSSRYEYTNVQPPPV